MLYAKFLQGDAVDLFDAAHSLHQWALLSHIIFWSLCFPTLFNGIHLFSPDAYR